MGSIGTATQATSRLSKSNITEQLRNAQAGLLDTTYQDIQNMDNIKYDIDTANLSDADKDVLKLALAQDAKSSLSKNNYPQLWTGINHKDTIQVSLNQMSEKNLIALVKMLSKSKLTASTTSLIEDALKRISYINQP